MQGMVVSPWGIDLLIGFINLLIGSNIKYLHTCIRCIQERICLARENWLNKREFDLARENWLGKRELAWQEIEHGKRFGVARQLAWEEIDTCVYVIMIFKLHIKTCFRLLLPASGCFRLLLPASGCCCLLQAAAACFRLLLPASGCCCLLQAATACFRLPMPASGCCCLLQAASVCCRLLQAAAVCFRLLLSASGSCCLLQAASGCCCLSSPPPNPMESRLQALSFSSLISGYSSICLKGGSAACWKWVATLNCMKTKNVTM